MGKLEVIKGHPATRINVFDSACDAAEEKQGAGGVGWTSRERAHKIW